VKDVLKRRQYPNGSEAVVYLDKSAVEGLIRKAFRNKSQRATSGALSVVVSPPAGARGSRWREPYTATEGGENDGQG
jgi:hypothetical protein